MNIGYSASIPSVLLGCNSCASIDSDMDTLGETVKRLRREHGWTQEYLGGLIGKSQRWVSDIENGHSRQPRLQNIRALADALGVDRGVLVAAADLTTDPAIAREIGNDGTAADALAALYAKVDDDLRTILENPSITRELIKTIENLARFVELSRPQVAEPETAAPSPTPEAVGSSPGHPEQTR